MRWRSVVLGVALAAVFTACGEETAAPVPQLSAAAAADRGGVAFYDTLFGVRDAGDETIDLLRHATRLNPQDGVSLFRLGMIQFFLYAQSVNDNQLNKTPAQLGRLDEAQRNLDAAVPLLPEDRRVPGFRAAITFTRGFAAQNESLKQVGLQQLRAAVDLYPEFNNFDFIGTVAPVVSPSDPLFAEALGYVGDPLTSACSPFTEPIICGNLGKAAHNVEGALVLFGDLYAKAGDTDRAKGFYRLAQASGASFPTSGGTWPFAYLVAERLRTASERVRLYRDDDPSNDPLLVGYGKESCAVCHYKG